MSASEETVNSTGEETGGRQPKKGPGGEHMGPIPIFCIALYLVLFCLLVLYGLVKLWPHPTPSGEPKQDTASAGSASPSPTQTPLPATAAPGPSPASTPQLFTLDGQGKPVPYTSTPTTTPAAASTSTPTPSPGSPAAQSKPNEMPDPELISFFGGLLKTNVYLETRLLLLVILGGILGSLLHALRSLYWYTGNRDMVWSWFAWYFLVPFTGAMLAVAFYFVVRGGFFSPEASFKSTSPFGFAALATLVGLFSQPAVLKLKEIAETVFTKPQPGADTTRPQDPNDKKGAGATNGAALALLTVRAITPNTGPFAGGTPVVISGTGFLSGAQVKFGNLEATVDALNSASMTVTTPAQAAPGPVDVEVINTDGKAMKITNGFTYI